MDFFTANWGEQSMNCVGLHNVSQTKKASWIIHNKLLMPVFEKDAISGVFLGGNKK